MTADEFVVNLRSIAPFQEDVYNSTLNDYGTMRESSRYTCIPRSAISVNPEPVLDLTCRYDCSQVEIGMVSFLAAPREFADCWQIGRDEADRLMLVKKSGEIVVEDLGDSRHVISDCAKSGSAFLEAMIETARSIEHLAQLGFPEDIALRRKLALVCTKAAGGARFETFYRYLLICV
jgi:hypothetical protein